MADRKRKTSVGEAFRVTLASLIFALGAQIAIVVGGLIFLVALRRGWPGEGDIFRLLLLSCLPWAIIAFQTILNTVRVIAGVTAESSPQRVPETRQDLRMIPVYRQQVPTVNGVDVEDLVFFIKRICATRDWTQRNWRGVRMPSGYRADDEYHRQMVEVLKQAGFIIGHKPRSSGRLLCTNPETIIEHLGLNERRQTKTYGGSHQRAGGRQWEH